MCCENGRVDASIANSATSPSGESSTTSGPAAPAQRSSRSVKDLVISLLVILLPIAALFALHRFVLGGGQPVVIDPSPVVADAKSVAGFPISEPVGLDEGWRPTVASFRHVEGGRTLRIGYVTPRGAGVQLVQSSVPADELLPAELSDEATPQGATELGGRSWQRYSARPGERALVLLEPQRTVVIVGDAAEEELAALAAALN
ncbi:MAG: DUF4245 domain-containing protein [Actinobacteria bacterium]|nr:MAG: DUF4245 domain-containing protein [Actinomycetota bacterium]